MDSQEVGADEVRVAIAAAGFTYFDAFVPAHREDLGLPEQVGLGFDFSGTVIEAGAQVSGLAVGDRVAGLHDDIAAPVRAHAEELVVAAATLALVPDRLDLQVAAAVPLSALTARRALDLLGPERGSLLVTGAAGAVGGWLVELAAREGWTVTASVRPGTESAVAARTVITELAGSYDAVLDAAALHAGAVAAVHDGGRYFGFKPGQPQQPQRDITMQTVQVMAQPWQNCCRWRPPGWFPSGSPAPPRWSTLRPPTRAPRLKRDPADAGFSSPEASVRRTRTWPAPKANAARSVSPTRRVRLGGYSTHRRARSDRSRVRSLRPTPQARSSR
jgi:NADPH:quinone reductase-like Zn-dependent oxidoreductase